MVFRWPIEIDGLPFLKMVDLSMAMLNNQKVTDLTKKNSWKIGIQPTKLMEHRKK